MDKFPSIEQFRTVVKNVQRFAEERNLPYPKWTFRGTVKLHGTNAAVRYFKGKLTPQSRSRILDVTNDNYEFAKFVSEVPTEVWDELIERYASFDDDVTIYGEWIGEGIQSGTAISTFEHREWVIIDVWVNGEHIDRTEVGADKPLLWFPGYKIYDILQGPVYYVTIDFGNPGAVVDELEKLTANVGQECPWGVMHGHKGAGEGIVWTCVERPEDSGLWFKTKNEKFMVTKTKKKVSLDPELLNSIEQFVDAVLTENRLNQGFDYLREMNLDIETRNLGHFLMWIAQDVKKEEGDTLEANKLEWKTAHKAVSRRAKEFFIKKMEEF